MNEVGETGWAKEERWLGFSHAPLIYNSAILANQWSSALDLNSGDSLVSTLFQACYYSHSFIQNAKLGFRPYYTWRNIRQSKSVIGNVSLWRIGEGDKVYVWNDRWVPNLVGHRVVSGTL